METSPLLLALKAVVFLGFVRSPFLFVLDSFLLAYLNFTRSYKQDDEKMTEGQRAAKTGHDKENTTTRT